MLARFRKSFPTLFMFVTVSAFLGLAFHAVFAAGTCSSVQYKPTSGYGRSELVTCTGTLNGTTAVTNDFTPAGPVLGGTIEWYTDATVTGTVTAKGYDKTFAAVTQVAYASGSELFTLGGGAGGEWARGNLFETIDANYAGGAFVLAQTDMRMTIVSDNTGDSTQGYVLRLHLLHP